MVVAAQKLAAVVIDRNVVVRANKHDGQWGIMMLHTIRRLGIRLAGALGPFYITCGSARRDQPIVARSIVSTTLKLNLNPVLQRQPSVYLFPIVPNRLFLNRQRTKHQLRLANRTH